MFNRYILLPFITLLSLAACSQHEKNTLSAGDAHKILLGKRLAGDSLSFWDYRLLDSVNTLVGVYTNNKNSRIQVYTMNAAAGLQPLHTDTLAAASHLTKTEWVGIGGRTLLIVDYLVAGKTADEGLAEFNLADAVKGKIYTLGYSYKYRGNTIRGEYRKKDLDSLKKHPQEFAFLQKEAGMSKLVPADDRINRRPSADSALKKWAMLNEGVYDALDDKDTRSMHLNVEEYNSDISPRLEDYNNDTLAFRSSTFLAENRDYKAVSQVKGPVFILNKGSNKSFIIWAPPQNLHWIDKLKFRSSGSLVLTPGSQDSTKDQVEYEVNIPQKTILKIILAKPVVKKAKTEAIVAGASGTAKSVAKLHTGSRHRSKSRAAAEHHKATHRKKAEVKKRRHKHHN